MLYSIGSHQSFVLYLEAHLWTSMVTQPVQNPPAMWETYVQSLGREDPLEKRMATHSSILAWRILVDRRAWLATVRGVAESQTRLSNQA